jgi:hypothetical protein
LRDRAISFEKVGYFAPSFHAAVGLRLPRLAASKGQKKGNVAAR